MTIQKEFLNVICCPNRRCRGDLVEFQDQELKPKLKCIECESIFPIIDGIPILYPNDKYSSSTHKRHWDLDHNATSYAKKYDSYLKKQGAPWGLYTHESELEAIKKLTKNIDLKDKIIIDGGCGNGRFLSSYPEAKIKIGVDTSLTLLQATKRREPNFWLVCAQLEDLPFKDAVADFSVSIRVYQHLRAPEHAFSEMVRTTKPSGHVCLEVYNKFNLKELYKRFRMLKWMNKRWPWGLGYDRYYSYREIEQWSRDNFVKPIQYSGAGWGIHFYFFELFRFRYYAPKWLQRIVFNFFLSIEKILGLWPFFSKTLEKVCFIGSVQSGQQNNKTISQKIKSRLKKNNQEKKVKNFQSVFENRNYCFVGDDRFHLNQSIDWIKKAQNATADAGVSRGFSLVNNGKNNDYGWQPSYPETTGYIIPTLLQASKLLNDPDLLQRAKRMADWELAIMFPDGAVHGGNISVSPNKAVFDTGQVIRGLLALYLENQKSKYLEAAQKSAKWILDNEYNKEGKWIQNNASCVGDNTTTYNIYAISPVVQLGVEIDSEQFKELGRRVANYTVRMQNEYGWFSGADFKVADDALLHTIAYTIDGLWDVGVLLGDDKYIHSAQKALDGIIKSMGDSGKIFGRLDNRWQGSVDWVCLTGSAQIALTCLKVFNKTQNKNYHDSAIRIKEYLKSCQNNFDENFGVLGAMWGSWPLSGGYGKYEALNWAVKYFADLLLDSIKLNDRTIAN